MIISMLTANVPSLAAAIRVYDHKEWKKEAWPMFLSVIIRRCGFHVCQSRKGGMASVPMHPSEGVAIACQSQ